MIHLSPVEASLEKGVLGETLNSTMLSNLLLGVYTAVYLGTMFVYFSQGAGSSQRWVVISATTLLYLLYVCLSAALWFQLEYAFIENSDTRDSIFSAISAVPTWFQITAISTQNLMVTIADGLMIWRCFHIWGGSWRIISVPLLLTLAEIALSIGLFKAYFDALYGRDPSGVIFTNINTALYFISVGASASTTALIVRRMQLGSSSLNTRRRVRYRYILIIFLESAAIYTFVLFLSAILMALPPSGRLAAPITQATIYISTVFPAITGMAPTILVARVIMAKSSTHVQPTLPTHISISGLKFQSAHPIDEESTQVQVAGLAGPARSTDFEDDKDDLESANRTNEE